jgi:hypothetical protein
MQIRYKTWPLRAFVFGIFWIIVEVLSLWSSSAMAQNPPHWRKVETPNPRGGLPLPALMRVGDIDRSDPGFVGMMVQCRDKTLQTVLVVVEPFSPGQSVQITLKAEGSSVNVTGTPIATGAGVTVPIDLASRLNAFWRSEPDLDVVIKGQGILHGTVPLDGLRGLIGMFDPDCRAGMFDASGTNAIPR